MRLRTRFYRALWQDGRDISDPEVVGALVGEVGLTLLDPSAHSDTVRTWTRAWAAVDADRRIPLMVSREGTLLTGLADVDTLRAFLWTQRADGEDSSGSCVPG